MKNALVEKYEYGTRYYADAKVFVKSIRNKTVIPYQVEVQPGPVHRGNLCWLRCSYCYGRSAEDCGARLSKERYVEIMKDIASGGVSKIIFAGYSTDPLNYSHIDDLLEVAIAKNQVFGFNTKALRMSDRFYELLSTTEIVSESYFNVSVDAGSNRVYNKVHGLAGSSAKLYERVLRNIERISITRERYGISLDISASYLVNSINDSEDEIRRFVRDFQLAGCNLLRLSFAQWPRGDIQIPEGVIPDSCAVRKYMLELRPLAESLSQKESVVIIRDFDAEFGICQKERALPCFARFIYPTVGFDGWLANCSQSASSDFHAIALGNLETTDFWDLYYNYDANELDAYFADMDERMAAVGCRCDRKEHVINNSLRNNGGFRYGCRS